MSFKEFLTFQKSDRKVLIVVLVVAAALAAVFFFVGGGMEKTTVSEEDSLAVAPVKWKKNDSTRYGRKYPPRERKYYQVDGRQAELFPFDPNTADSTEFLRLGLQEWQIRNIYKFRAKGGIYRKPEDFARLYGLTVKQYKQMEPYIQISSDYAPAATLVEEREPFARDTMMHPVKLSVGEHITLNDADTTMLKKVPGIGSAFARAIVRYGERLGGYCSVEQLREIDGFPEESLSYFEIKGAQIRKLNLNKLSVNELKKHPYLGFYRARAIDDYRRMKGPLRSLDDLRLHRDFPPDVIEKLKPYVEF